LKDLESEHWLKDLDLRLKLTVKVKLHLLTEKDLPPMLTDLVNEPKLTVKETQR
jgi:hypothetical protein